MGNLFTVGHSQHSMEYFVKLLKIYNIGYVLDVRSVPYSKYAEQFNREVLEKKLFCFGIKYSFMGSYFGARSEDANLYCDEGYLDFERVRKSSQFLKGFNNVVLGLKKGNNIALMCTEKDPFDCHRAIMVARAFDLSGIEAKHILADGRVQSQSMLNERLLNKYYPDRNQMTFFDYINSENDIDYLSMAYQLRNKEIGYHLEIKEYAFA